MTRGQARLAAVAAAILFSTGGAAIKTAAFTPAQVSCVRSGVAAVALLLWAGRRLQWSRDVAGVGIVYAATLTLFVASTRLTTAANAIFLQSTAPLYILLLAPLLLRERVTRHDMVYMAALSVGLAFCFLGQPPASATAPNPALGNILGVICSWVWALTLLGLRWTQRSGRDVGLSAVIAGNVLAFAAALPLAWPFPGAAIAEWGTLLYLGVIQIALAYICLTAAMRELPALDVALLLLVEPVLNPFWTWLVRDEQPGRWVLVGGTIIIAATAAKSIVDAARAHTKPVPRPV